MLMKKYRLVSRKLLPFNMTKNGADLEFWCERHKIERLKFTRMTLFKCVEFERKYLKTEYMFYQYGSKYEFFELFTYGFIYVTGPINLFDNSDSWISRIIDRIKKVILSWFW